MVAIAASELSRIVIRTEASGGPLRVYAKTNQKSKPLLSSTTKSYSRSVGTQNHIGDDNYGGVTAFSIFHVEIATTVAIALTAADGSYYHFSELKLGDYNVFEQNLPTFPIDASDKNTDPDAVPDPTDADIAVDTMIDMKLQPQEFDKGNGL